MNKKLKTLIKQLGDEKNIGSSQNKGWAYHGLPFKDIEIKTHRKNLEKRMGLLLSRYDCQDKTGIDLGCNIGGFVFGCQLHGAKMTGYDYDFASINLANEIEAIKHTGAKFFCKPITERILQEFDRVDFVVWLSQFMWMVRSLGAEDALVFMYDLSLRVNDTMFFETSLEDSMAGKEMVDMKIISKQAVRNLLINNTCFTKIEYLGYFEDGWSHRPVFQCSAPKTEWRGATATIRRTSADTIRKIYADNTMEGFSLRQCRANESLFLKRLKDSPHFPQHYGNTELEITMDYCGVPLTKENMPGDCEKQVAEILGALYDANIVHRDIRPANLLVKDNIIKLIDFGWSCEKERAMIDFPKGLGWDFRPGFPEPATRFDDEYSLRKSIRWILAH
jgi:hypothetical protein